MDETEKKVNTSVSELQSQSGAQVYSAFQHGAQTDRLQTFDSIREVPHEGEGAYSLAQTRDLPKANHELIFDSQLLQWTAVLLVVEQKLSLVVRWYEVLQ